MIGKLISHYRVVNELGRGGMGVVYKAEDTKLDRTVALKFLPPQALITEDDRARFYREARAAAALHHPNIATVFEIDEVPGDGGATTPLIAMEYVDGETLSEQIARGPLPLKDAISIASQVARGLAAAHEKNIIHRDVKAGNVMIANDGTVKILDFGLAKTSASTRLTQMGSTLGTAAYMSPEQARGEEVDTRSDIWSLGVILYEMIAGRLPFPGDYEQAVVYGILNSNPEPLSGLRTGVPLELERIVDKCLDKDPGKRYRHASEIEVDLGRIDLAAISQSRTAAIVVSDSGHRSRNIKYVWAFGGLAAGVVATVFAAWLLGSAQNGTIPSNERPVHRLSLTLPAEFPLEPVGTAILGVGASALDLRSDSRRLVYVASVDGLPMLAVRAMDTGQIRTLQGTERAYFPVISPSGDWIAFIADGKMKKVSAGGGAPLELSDTADPNGVAWIDDNRIVVSSRQGSKLKVIDANDGSTLSEVDGSNWSDLSVLPDGKAILLSDRRNVWMLSLDSFEGKQIIERGTSPRYVRSGHVVFARPGRLFAVPFDIKTREVTGSPVPVIDDVRTESVNRSAQFTVSDDGTLIYVPGGAAERGRLTWVERDGGKTPLDFEPELFGTFRLSPEGDRLAIVELGDPGVIWIYDLVRKSRTRFGEGSRSPLWTPDGRSIVYTTRTEGKDTYSMIMRPATGGAATTLLETEAFADPFSWSPDGGMIAYYQGLDLWVLPFKDGVAGGPRPWLLAPERLWSPVFSRDGQYIAYTLIGERNSEVYVGPVDASDVRWQISVDGGEEPQWSPTGRELFYSRGRVWYSVPVTTSPEFRAGTPRVLFEGNYLNVPGLGYAVSPAGSKFLVVESAESDEPVRELKVVENWFAELRRVAPVGH